MIMMKKLIISLSAILAVANVIAAQAKPKLTPEQIEERKYRHFGGHIYQPQETKVVSIVNEQSTLSEEALANIAAEMQALLMIPVSVNASKDVGVTLKVCDCDKLGPLVVLPDNATACVSVKLLSADNPAPELLEKRVSQELWRGLIYTLGGGNTFIPQCVMKQIASLKDLDSINARGASPDAFARAKEGAAKLGIKPARRVTYRQACKEGWAPAPTNDVQKAVMDRVQMEKGFEKQTKNPTNPIRIKYEKDQSK